MKMKKLRSLISYVPELILFALIIHYWISTYPLNPVAWCLVLLLILQVILQRRALNLVLASLFMFLALWMLLAFLSDCAKITEYKASTRRFLIFGISFCGLLISSSVWMFVKYYNKPTEIKD